MKIARITIGLFCLSFLLVNCNSKQSGLVPLHKGARIFLIGNNLGSRMINFGHFETDLQLRYPDSLLYIRNMCDGGNTPGFRPHAGRVSPWAFPGAEQFQTELATNSYSEGHFETDNEWLTRLKADIIIGFFGYNESFSGAAGLENYKAELDAFTKYTLTQKYNGITPPKLVLVSPIAFEDLSDKYDYPNGKKENENLALYTAAMKAVADSNQVPFIDVFTPSQKWYAESADAFTIDGSQLNDAGYAKLGELLADEIFGKNKPASGVDKAAVHAAVMEKNWIWHNDYKIPNGVHVFGRRYNPFGPENYPAELTKLREMAAIRDTAIWFTAQGKTYDLAAADKRTVVLPEVKTNYKDTTSEAGKYLDEKEALAAFTMAPGYKIELFASEKEFPDLAKPCQIAFDNKGRLWVATMPSYPHYKPGDSKPNDKIIILEDTNGDGRADKQIVFADKLHLPVGFEITSNGVFISQGTNLKWYKDTDGDDKADVSEIVMSGFDDHDTHHNIHAFCADPSGAIYMGEGVFLHTNVETSYGTVRGTNGGFYRFDPNRRQLERTAQLEIPNPWGIAFDEWGENFFAETSGPDVRWMMPGTVKPRYGDATPKSANLIEEKHRVRPTSGLEFISSRHFPEEVQGDMLINNTIGFLGMKEHVVEDDGTGYKSHHRQDLVQSSDKNFRPVDMEFAPDGSLYMADWHNVLIGHMQHNARDPLRDHSHGRIYRITYPARPLLKPVQVAGASIENLLENLKQPEYRVRYRTRRELRGNDAGQVLSAITNWVAKLDPNDPQYEHNMLEALWVSWGLNKVDQSLLNKLLQAKDYRARAAAVRVVRYTGHQVKNQVALLQKAASDENGRVRLEAIVASSWLDKNSGMDILNAAAKMPMDAWMQPAYTTALAHLNDKSAIIKKEELAATHLKGKAAQLYEQGKFIYFKEGYCNTCHQADGAGLKASGFPPLTSNPWVNGDEDRLIKLVLNGLMGPIEVQGHKYPGQVPMTPFGGLLNDEELAAVVTYVRNSFGNKASVVTPEKVKQVRAATKDKKGFYTPEELLK